MLLINDIFEKWNKLLYRVLVAADQQYFVGWLRSIVLLQQIQNLLINLLACVPGIGFQLCLQIAEWNEVLKRCSVLLLEHGKWTRRAYFEYLFIILQIFGCGATIRKFKSKISQIMLVFLISKQVSVQSQYFPFSMFDYTSSPAGNVSPPHPSYPRLQTSSNIPQTMALRSMLQNIDRLIQFHRTTHTESEDHRREPSGKSFGQRDQYKELLNWHQMCLMEVKSQLKSSQITIYNSTQQQHSILLATMQKLGQVLSKQCEEKGRLVKMLTLQHFYLHHALSQYMDHRFRANLTDRVSTQSKIETQYAEQVRLLKQELESLKEGKDKKWRNLFMLIKDNRLLRRTKGKLMRELQASLYRQQQFKENIIELTKENERYKLLSHSLDDKQDGLQKWLKNLSSLIKIERYIQKEPSKAKRILQFQLQNLQINQMEALPQKIQYVIKAIEEAEQLVDYYEDLNDLIAPCKLLLNSYTQTQLTQESVGTNTLTVKCVNAYSQAKPAWMLKSSCKIVPAIFNLNNSEEKYLKKGNVDGLRRKESIFLEGRSDRNQGSIFGIINANRKENKNSGLTSMRVVKVVEETILPKYTWVSEKNNDNCVYKDSKFAYKLCLKQRQVEVKINGVFGFVSLGPTNYETNYGSLSKPKQNPSQKRYTQQGQDIFMEQLMHQMRAGKLVNTKSSTNAIDKIAPSQEFQPELVWANKKNKRYSYNSRMLPVHNKYKRVSNTDNLSATVSDFHQPPTAIEESRDLSQFLQGLKINKPSDQERADSVSGIVDDRSGAPNETINNEPLSEVKPGLQNVQIKQKQTGLKSGVFDKNKKLAKMKQKIEKITRGKVPVLSSKIMKPNALPGFRSNDKNSRSSQRSINSSCTSEYNMGNTGNARHPNIYRSSTLTKRDNLKEESSPNLRNALPMDQNKNSQTLGQHKTKCQEHDTQREDIAKSHGADFKSGNFLTSIVSNKSCGPRRYPDRNCSNFSINIRASYRVAPIAQEEDILEENNLQQDPSSISSKQLFGQEFLIDKNAAQLEASQVDAQKIISKVLHLLFINRNDLKQSQKTLREYMETNLRNIYGLTSQSHFGSFNKSLALTLDPSLCAFSFMRLLNHTTSTAYQNDLFKLYLILMDKCGNAGLLCEMEKAAKIVQYATSLFYNEADVAQKWREVKNILTILSLKNSSKINKIHQNTQLNKTSSFPVNLNQYFLILEAELRSLCLQTQFYSFCQQVLPENQTDLNYQQFSEILKFLPQNAQHQIHLSRLKLYFSSDKPKYNSRATTGMKIHKISLYCSREKWKELRDISTTIENNFRVMQDKLCLEELMELFDKLQKSQFGECRIKEACPWIYGLAKNQVKKYKDYGGKISKSLLKIVWLIEINLRTQFFGLLGVSLGVLAKQTRKMIVSKELIRFIGTKGRQNNQNRRKSQKQQNKAEEIQALLNQGKHANLPGTNVLKISKSINVERK